MYWVATQSVILDMRLIAKDVTLPLGKGSLSCNASDHPVEDITTVHVSQQLKGNIFVWIPKQRQMVLPNFQMHCRPGTESIR